jgi:hypothetical protein
MGVPGCPKVINSGEPNYLLNPAQPDSKKKFIGKRAGFMFDCGRSPDARDRRAANAFQDSAVQLRELGDRKLTEPNCEEPIWNGNHYKDKIT